MRLRQTSAFWAICALAGSLLIGSGDIRAGGTQTETPTAPQTSPSAATAPPVAPPPPVPIVKPRTANLVLHGTLVSQDEIANKITLKLQPAPSASSIVPRADPPTSAEGETVSAFLGLQTRFVRDGKVAKLTDFGANEAVVARVTYGGTAAAKIFVRELWDAKSFAENQKTRTKITSGRVVRFLSDAVEVKDDSNGTARQFRVTAKTRIVKNGRDVRADQYTPGAAIAVKPRGLPNGGVMAALIGESASAVEQAHMDNLSRWIGTLQGVDRVANTLTMAREDGATRTVLLANDAQVRVSRKKATLADLRAGQAITIYLTKESLNKERRTTDRITVSAGKARGASFPGLSSVPLSASDR